MIGLEDRHALARDIHAAHTAGARLTLACETAGIDRRTVQRWKAHEGLVGGDGRPQAVRPAPSHALSEAERAQLRRMANEPRFAAVPPARIVIRASSSTFLVARTFDFVGSSTASMRRMTHMGRMTSGYLPRLKRSRRTSSAMPQMNETILLCVAWSTLCDAPS